MNTTNIISIVFGSLGLLFLILSATRTNPVQSKAWLRTGIIFVIVAAFLYFYKSIFK